MSHRFASSFLLAVILLDACRTDSPAGPVLDANSIQGPQPLIQQGACGVPTTFPFLSPGTTRPLGSFTTYWDDYSLYGQFQAGTGAGFTRSSLTFLELPDVVYLPTKPNGKVDAEAFPLRTRSEVPVPVIEERVPMDGVNDRLQEYGAVPKVVIQGVDGTRRQAWAGEPIPWDKDPEARHVPVYMIPLCGPRVTVVMDLNLFDQGGFSGNARFADALLWQKEEPAGKAVYFGRNFGVNGSFTVMFDRGRASPCWSDGSCSDAALASLREAYQDVTLVAGSRTFTHHPEP